MAETRLDLVRLELPADPRYFRLAAACVAELVASSLPPGDIVAAPVGDAQLGSGLQSGSGTQAGSATQIGSGLQTGSVAAPVAVSAVSHDLQLAVQEICANIATHAYHERGGGRFAIEMGINDGVFTAEFRDRGDPFDPEGAHDPDLVNGQVHGYGLYLVRTLVDELTYHYEAGENCWRLAKRLR